MSMTMKSDHDGDDDDDENDGDDGDDNDDADDEVNDDDELFVFTVDSEGPSEVCDS